MENNQDMLEVAITKKLKNFAIDVDFSANCGCLGILGASGCGKSMTLRTIAGIVRPDSGKIQLTNRGGKVSVLYDSTQRIHLKPQLRKVGYLFQNYALFPNMTVEENIAIGMRNACQREENDKDVKYPNPSQLTKIIRMFHLDGLEKQYPGQLSGGQQQRVALARIFAYRPEVLLLDEPFSAMDSFLREGLRLELLAMLKEEFQGISLLVTHDRDEAYQMCDSLILMHDGKILQQGNTKDVFQHPTTFHAARLTGCKNIVSIEKVNQYLLRVPSWNHLEIKTDQEISDQIQYIGIRAHDFVPLQEEPKDMSYVTVDKYKVSELPFEMYITLENGIWWKIDKKQYQNGFVMPKYLGIKPESVILLQ